MGCRPKHSPPLRRVGNHSFIHLLYTPQDEFYDVQFDLLLAESAFEQSALQNSVRRDVPGVELPIRVVDCNDLILMKLVSGRLIDRADCAMLVRENHTELDLPYLGGWLRELRLIDDWEAIWGDAFPGESLPVLD
jgi:hypothetical protein